MTPLFTRTTLLLSGLLLLGLCLFTCRITKKGLFFNDEAYYLLEAKTSRSAVEWAAGHWQELRSGKLRMADLKTYLKDSGCIFPLGTAKPAYLLTLTAWNMLIGTHDYSSFLLSALSATILLLILFRINSSLWGESAAFFGIACVLLSTQYLFYARSGFTQALATLLLFSALYSCLKEKYALAGFLLACSFASHYCTLFNAALCFFWIAVYNRKKLLPFIAAFALPLLVLEAAYRVEKVMLGPWLTDIKFYTYFQLFARQMAWVSPSSGAASPSVTSLLHHDWMALPNILWTEGPFLVILSLAFLALPFYKRASMSKGAWLIWLNGWGALLLWFINPGQVISRAIFPAWIVVLAGSGCVLSRVRPRSLLIAFLACAAVFSGIRTYKVIMLTSPYREAALWMEQNGQKEIIDFFNAPIYQFYLGKKIPANFDSIRNREDLISFYKKGIIILGIDYYNVYFRGLKDWQYVEDIINTVKPVAAFPVRFTAYPWLENHYTTTRTDRMTLHNAPPETKTLRLYDLRQYYPAKL